MTLFQINVSILANVSFGRANCSQSSLEHGMGISIENVLN